MENLQLTSNEIEDLKALLFALEWFNDTKENHSNITPVLIDGINPITKEPITECIEMLNKIAYYKSSISEIHNKIKGAN